MGGFRASRNQDGRKSGFLKGRRGAGSELLHATLFFSGLPSSFFFFFPGENGIRLNRGWDGVGWGDSVNDDLIKMTGL